MTDMTLLRMTKVDQCYSMHLRNSSNNIDGAGSFLNKISSTVSNAKIEEKINILDFFTQEVKGLEFNPFTQKWKRSNDLSVNYIVTSIKN